MVVTCAIILSFGYFVTVKQMGSPEETPSIKAENEFTQQLRDLEWRIKSAMAQSNQRSRDFVDIRNDISAVAQRMIAREARVSRKPFPRAPSSLDQPVHAVVDKVAGSDMERLGAELLPGMDHLHSSQSLQPAFELSKQRQGGEMTRKYCCLSVFHLCFISYVFSYLFVYLSTCLQMSLVRLAFLC